MTQILPQIQTNPTPEIDDRVKLACDIATGRIPALNSTRTRVAGAQRGSGPESYRIAFSGPTDWRYVSADRMADERRATVYGDVFTGEIVVSHDRGGPVDFAWLVIPDLGDAKVLRPLAAPKLRRDGKIVVTLPDGSDVALTNPRKS